MKLTHSLTKQQVKVTGMESIFTAGGQTELLAYWVDTLC